MLIVNEYFDPAHFTRMLYTDKAGIEVLQYHIIHVWDAWVENNETGLPQRVITKSQSENVLMNVTPTNDGAIIDYLSCVYIQTKQQNWTIEGAQQASQGLWFGRSIRDLLSEEDYWLVSPISMTITYGVPKIQQKTSIHSPWLPASPFFSYDHVSHFSAMSPRVFTYLPKGLPYSVLTPYVETSKIRRSAPTKA